MPLRRYLVLLGTYLRPRWPRVALLAALLLGSIGLQLAFPQIVRQFIDAAQAGADLAALAGVALLYLGAAVAAQVVATGEAYVAANVGQVATNAMRADLALHCLRLDTTFHNARAGRTDRAHRRRRGCAGQLLLQLRRRRARQRAAA